MLGFHGWNTTGWFGIMAALMVPTVVLARERVPIILPEQTTISVRDPSARARQAYPAPRHPVTVSHPGPSRATRHLSLDDAIRLGLRNVDVIRVLAGVTATSSGRTIYDPAISNAVIDERQGRFDPSLSVRNSFNRFDTPAAIADPLDPSRSVITGSRSDDYSLDLDLTKTTNRGGVLSMGLSTNPSRFRPGVLALNPQNRSSFELGITQPLLQGAGKDVNMAPVVVARIDTERSFFQMKDSVQELVRGIIEAYWNLVFARTNRWARRQQVEQSRFAFQLAEAQFKTGDVAISDVAQARSALEGFRASLIAAQSNVIQREAALRNILGLPPTDGVELVPVTPPTTDRRAFDWEQLVYLAEQRRPDLIELKLIIEADQQLLIQAENDALPALDAVAVYRWNGLEGEMPSGARLSSGPGQFTDWTLGVNFSVPIGLRQPRAALRRRELIVTRDWTNLRQGVHATVHQLAFDLRNLDQLYAQYDAFRATRSASRENLRAQSARYRSDLTILLNVLQAIASWGDAVSSEAQSLTQYNIELANLEKDTGTILETHGVRFSEERREFLAPLCHLKKYRLYPSAIQPTFNAERYKAGGKPAEESFNLEPPAGIQRDGPDYPPVDPPPPVPRPPAAAEIRRLPSTR